MADQASIPTSAESMAWCDQEAEVLLLIKQPPIDIQSSINFTYKSKRTLLNISTRSHNVD